MPIERDGQSALGRAVQAGGLEFFEHGELGPAEGVLAAVHKFDAVGVKRVDRAGSDDTYGAAARFVGAEDDLGAYRQNATWAEFARFE